MEKKGETRDMEEKRKKRQEERRVGEEGNRDGRERDDLDWR